MSKFETGKILIVSTAHMSREDNEILMNHGVASPELLEILSFSYGWLVFTPIDELIELSCQESHLSSGFTNVIKTASKEGFGFVLFDRDGPEYDEFELYNW